MFTGTLPEFSFAWDGRSDTWVTVKSGGPKEPEAGWELPTAAWKAELHTVWGPELWSQADLGLNPALSPTNRTSFLRCIVETQQDNACKMTSPGEGNKCSINGDYYQ